MEYVQVNDDLYCKIYIDTESKVQFKDLVLLISNFIHGEEEFANSYHNDFIEVDIRTNKEYDPCFRNNKKDGFLFFKYYLEVNAIINVEQKVFISQLKSLIDFLRLRGFRVVPSCDFEDELNDGKPYTEFMK